MKKFSLLLVACGLFSVSALATGLLPASNPVCANGGVDVLCAPGTQFMTDSQGRCECLGEKDYFDAKTCKIALIRCSEGTNFDSLYVDQNTCGLIEKKHVGCGCFSTLGQ